MAKLYKVEMYVLDINENYHSLGGIIEDAENSIEVDFIPFNVQETEIEWDDDIDLNKRNVLPLEAYRKYFK
ncbi:MAG: hypothetical protein K0R54_130 [Clostridiaceae bacterium]|jgi:hypothetical protein|nr:hypothetical protein [Clostridiaceae bacterium]